MQILHIHKTINPISHKSPSNTTLHNTTYKMFYCKNCIMITETIHEMRRHLVLKHLGYAIYGYLFSVGRTDPIRPDCYYPTCIRNSQAIRWENYLQYIFHMALDHNVLDEYLRDSCTNPHTLYSNINEYPWENGQRRDD